MDDLSQVGESVILQLSARYIQIKTVGKVHFALKGPAAP
jgi:hypothetical protein